MINDVTPVVMMDLTKEVRNGLKKLVKTAQDPATKAAFSRYADILEHIPSGHYNQVIDYIHLIKKHYPKLNIESAFKKVSEFCSAQLIAKTQPTTLQP